ncbi:MAG: tetratricopeptide repeat protein [Polyangiaceae bacterium]
MRLGSRLQHRWVGAVGLITMVVAMGTVSGRAWALTDSDKEAIRALSNEAAADFDAGRYDLAREKFARAYALAKVPRLAVWEARAAERLGRLVSAYELYRQAIRLERNELWIGDVQEQAQRDAERELQALVPRLAKVTIVVEGAEPSQVEVKIDGESVPNALLGVARFVDPGAREIVGIHRGETLRRAATIVEGGQARVVLAFNPSGPAVSSQPVTTTGQNQSSAAKPVASASADSGSQSGDSQRTWGWIGLGVGAAGVLTGAITGVIVASKYGELKSDCPERTCSDAESSRLDSYRSMRTVSTVGFIVGGVGTAVGLTLVLTSPTPSVPKRDASQLRLRVAPNAALIEGVF